MAKVSIIVPVYNSEKSLRRCINSILDQKEKDIEVILVDDGSTDKSLSICEEFSISDSRVTIIKKSNGGPHSARKVGIEIASSSYIAFVDSDDYIDDTLISSMLIDINRWNVDCIICGYSIFEEGKRKTFLNDISTGIYRKKELINNIYSQMLCPSNSFKQRIIPSLCAKIFKKDILAPIMEKLDDDIFIGEDLACTFRYILESNSIYINNSNTGYLYCIHEDSNSYRYDAHYFDKVNRLSFFLYQTIDELGYSSLKENIDRFIINQIYRIIGIAINSKNRDIFNNILSDVTKTAGKKEIHSVLSTVPLNNLEINNIEKRILISLRDNKVYLFRIICTLLYYLNKRNRK